MKKANLGVVGSLFLGACTSGVGPVHPLNEEEQRYFERVLMIGDLCGPTLEGMLAQAKVPFYDAEGNVIDTATYLEDLADIRAAVRESYEAGKVYGFSSAESPDVDVEGADVPMAYIYSQKDASFAMNTDILSGWDLGMVTHEMGHIVSDYDRGLDGGHSLEIFASSTNERSEGFAELTWEEKDYAYMQSVTYGMIDYFLSRNDFESHAIYLSELVQGGEITSEEALGEYDEQRYENAEAWAESFRSDGTFGKEGNIEPLVTFFNLTDDNVINALQEGRLFEQVERDWAASREVLQEKLREFNEARAERRAELRASMEPPRQTFRRI